MLQRSTSQPKGSVLEVTSLVDTFCSSVLPSGPGNLTTSDEKARSAFNLATKLIEYLRSGHDPERPRDLPELARDALYRVKYMGETSTGTFVQAHVSEHSGGMQRKQLGSRGKRLVALAEVVVFDFVVRKTGGGSCDHCSAWMLFQLAERIPEAHVQLVRYKPASDETWNVEAPKMAPFHRSILLQHEKESVALEVDAWWPPSGRIDLQKKTYPESSVVVAWDPEKKQWKVPYEIDDLMESSKGDEHVSDEFVKSLRVELELEFASFQAPEVDSEVTLTWKISQKKK